MATLKICDRCKRIPDDQELEATIHLRWEGRNWKKLNTWIGRDNSIDLCNRCFDDFMKFNPTTS